MVCIYARVGFRSLGEGGKFTAWRAKVSWLAKASLQHACQGRWPDRKWSFIVGGEALLGQNLRPSDLSS